MTTPNPTPTTLKETLLKILPDDWGDQELRIDEAIPVIQKQLKALLPKKQKLVSGYGENITAVNIRREGYNQSIDELQKAIEEWAK